MVVSGEGDSNCLGGKLKSVWYWRALREGEGAKEKRWGGFECGVILTDRKGWDFFVEELCNANSARDDEVCFVLGGESSGRRRGTEN